MSDLTLLIICVLIGSALGYAWLAWFLAWKTRRTLEREAAERRRAAQLWMKFKGD